MWKNVLLIVLALLCFSAPAQTGRKVRNTADNSSENVSARKISSRFNNGLRSFYTAQTDDAERIFSDIVRDNPKHAPSYFMLSKIYTEKGQFSEAEIALNNAIKADKDNVWYRVALGENYIKTENFKKATPIWESICKEMPDNELFLFNLYDCYQHLNNYSKMIETLDIMEDKFGPREEFTRNKVILWLRKNDLNSAIGEYDKLIEKQPYEVTNYLRAGVLCEEHNLSDKAVSYYERAYKIFPDNPEVNMMLANFYILKNDEEKSLQYIQYVIPNPEVGIEKKIPFIRKQIQNMDQNSAKKVEEWARQLVSAHPDDYQSHEALAEVCMKLGKFSEAADNYEKLLDISNSAQGDQSSYVQNWESYVKSVEKTGNLVRLLKYEDDIATIFPQTPAMLAVLAKAFLQSNNPDKAIEYYKQALAFAYDADEISKINKGLYDAYMMKGDTENAKRYNPRN